MQKNVILVLSSKLLLFQITIKWEREDIYAVIDGVYVTNVDKQRQKFTKNADVLGQFEWRRYMKVKKLLACVLQ